MRRMLLTMAASLLSALILFVPGAYAEGTDQGEETDKAEVDTVRPPRPKIRCHGALTFGGHPKVNCKWTASEHPDAAGYKIIRRGGGERKVVFRTGDIGVTRFADKEVKFGVRYRYRVVVVNEAGKRIQRSRWNSAIVRKPNTERLHMDCSAVEVDPAPTTDVVDAKSVLCEWKPVESTAATEYQLWRRLRGQHRELVATVGLDQLSYVDTVPADTGKVIYAVLALDADGKIVGRSGVSKVLFPDDEA